MHVLMLKSVINIYILFDKIRNSARKQFSRQMPNLMKNILRSFIVLFLFSNLAAQKSYTLQEAIAAQLVAVKVISEGGFSGQSLSLLVDKVGKNDFEIQIPAGQLFLPQDPSLQTLVNVKDEILVLDQTKKKKRIYGLCTEAHDGSPGQGAEFAVGEIAKGALQQVVQFLSKQKLYSHPDAQSAIWAVTNDYPVATIVHSPLLQITCLALGIAEPEYKIILAEAAAAVAGQPAMQFKPLRIEGHFEYASDEPCTLNVYLKDEKGENIRTLIPDRPFLKGKTRFTFKFETTKLESGKYQVCLDNGQKVVKCINVDYKAMD